MARKDNPKLVRCDDMQQLIALMSTRFTIGTHDACALLQCSRSWWDANIKPRLHYVFANKRALAAIKTAEALRLSHQDHCWYDAGELFDLIGSHARIERRTKRLSLERFLADEKGYCKAIADAYLTSADIRTLNGYEADKARRRQAEIMADHLNAEGRALLGEAIDFTVKRTRFDYVEVGGQEREQALAALQREAWHTVADMMDYGDAAETHYRQLFIDGALRCTIELPQPGGKSTRHVMWCPDPLPVYAEGETAQVSDQWVVVPAEAWYRIGGGLC